MTTTVGVVESLTTVTDNTSSVSVTVTPTVVNVTLSTGPITIGGTSYTTLSGVGSPLGVVTPEFAGQLYQATDTGLIYVSFSLASSGWIELLRNF